MKAIRVCDRKGWRLAAPLLVPIEGLTSTGEGSLSLVVLSLVNLESSDMGKRSSSLLFSFAILFVITLLL